MQTNLQNLFNGVRLNAVESGTLLYIGGKSIRLEDGKTNTCYDKQYNVLYMTTHIYERLKDELSKRNF
jgi:hypothetical protein